MPDAPHDKPDSSPPGLVHGYLGFDPKNFPSPTTPPPDLASEAMEHLLAHGSMREFTDEELANAVRLDASMLSQIGPSLESLAAMLRERKARILETYETTAAAETAAKSVQRVAGSARTPRELRGRFERAVKSGHVRDLEQMWYAQSDENSPFSRDLLKMMETLGERLQIEQMASRYEFTGRTQMDVPKALAIKEELETIDKLLAQIAEAMKHARLAIIDMDALAEFAEPEDIEALNRLQEQLQEYMRREAERQGVERTREGYRLTPQAFRIFQSRLLKEIFSQLQAARSGRHEGPIVGEGVVEIARTRPFEFGDAATNIDVGQTLTNAMIRAARDGGGRGGLRADDIEVHLTRNHPRCATCVLLDMSGSMRHGGQYVNVKRMALALDGLIRSEYPGDFLQFIEIYTFAKPRHVSEIATLMPKPVSIFQPFVRLKADMSDPEVIELRIPQHFTNIQRGLDVARQFLAAQDTPNRQIILITDGLPTAHFEDEMLYMLYPPDARTEEATMRSAGLCAREQITINIFLLPGWSQTHEDVQFAQRMAMATRGRVFFTGGRDLDRYVLWDYVSQRRKIVS